MKFIDGTIRRFLLVGIGNTAAGLTIIYTAKLFGVDDIAANAIGYGCGLVLSFFLNKKWTFQHTDAVLRTSCRFALVTAIAYFANLAVVMFCIRKLELNAFVAQLMGAPAYSLTSYLGCRHFVFPPDGRTSGTTS